MSIRGFIFDLDGVLTDTAEYHYQSWKRLADEHGLPFSREYNEHLRGVSRRRSLEPLLAGQMLPEEQMLEMMERKNRYYQGLLLQVSANDLLPGVRNLLDELRRAKIRVAIGSASKNAREVVRRLEIGNEIEAIADGYSVVRQKPAPDLFVYAAGMLRLPVDQCVVIEDAAAGVEAAKVAGMLTIGLGPPQRVGQADVIFPDLSQVTLNGVLQRLRGSEVLEGGDGR